ARRTRLRLEERELIEVRAGLEGVDRARPLIGNHEQIAGLVKRKLNGIERIIPHDGKLARRRRPAINLLPFGIDKIEVAGTVDGATGNIEEAANEFLYSGAIGEDWSGSHRNSLRLGSGNGEPCKFALANFNMVSLVENGIVKRDFAVAVAVHIAEADIF